MNTVGSNILSVSPNMWSLTNMKGGQDRFNGSIDPFFCISGGVYGYFWCSGSDGDGEVHYEILYSSTVFVFYFKRIELIIITILKFTKAPAAPAHIDTHTHVSFLFVVVGTIKVFYR